MIRYSVITGYHVILYYIILYYHFKNNTVLHTKVSDVLVRTRSTQTLCPLLSKMQRDPIAVEREIRKLLGTVVWTSQKPILTTEYA